MFFPLEKSGSNVIVRGDTLAARCVIYNDRNETVRVGPTRDDEMCNFYLMYYVNGSRLLRKNVCYSPGPPSYSFDAVYNPFEGLFGGGLENVPS